MEFPNKSSPPPFPSEDIRYLQSKIQTEIENIEKDVSECTNGETINLCKTVEDRILIFEDKPQLSKVQNNLRRIHIASELIIGICSVHERIVDFALTKIINDLLHPNKYKIISSKISHKISSNLKKEKYFAKEAHNKLLKSLKDRNNLEEKEGTNKRILTQEKVALTEKEPEADGLHHFMDINREIPLDGIEQTLIEDSFTDNRHLIGDLTEIRAEPPAETSNLNVHISIPKETSLQATEISIREPAVQQPLDENIIEILQNGYRLTKPDVRKSGLSENLLESITNVADAGEQVEKMLPPTGSLEKQIYSEESTEEWSLSTLESVDIPRKKYLKLKIDELTTIPNYSIRAMSLNKNIDIQRVQVFEGPPKILQSMSSEYLMQTSGFKRFMSQNVRNSRLTRLYKRNLVTDKRPPELFKMPKKKRSTERRINVSEVQAQESLQIRQGPVEEVGEKTGMRAASVKSGTLTELPNEKRIPEVSANEMLERKSLMGMPMSRITSPVLRPPEPEKIDDAIPIPSPRIQQLQGTIFDPKTTSQVWLFSTKEKPPRAEFRKFSYVKNKLENYWSLYEMQGMEKSISIREFLTFEEDGNFANYLTILRVVDKLSIQRLLFLEHKDGDVLIKPFESPYVSKNQILLGKKEPHL